MARHQLDRKTVCAVIGMHVNSFSNFVGGYRPLPGWAAHNIAYGINRVTGQTVFDVRMGEGIKPMDAVPFKPRKLGVRLPTPSRRKRARRAPKAS